MPLRERRTCPCCGGHDLVQLELSSQFLEPFRHGRRSPDEEHSYVRQPHGTIRDTARLLEFAGRPSRGTRSQILICASSRQGSERRSPSRKRGISVREYPCAGEVWCGP